jgi:hypothetical protein
MELFDHRTGGELRARTDERLHHRIVIRTDGPLFIREPVSPVGGLREVPGILSEESCE